MLIKVGQVLAFTGFEISFTGQTDFFLEAGVRTISRKIDCHGKDVKLSEVHGSRLSLTLI